MNLSNITVWFVSSSKVIGSPFTVMLATLYPTFGLTIMSFLLSWPLSTLSYTSSPSPLMFPPIPSTFVVMLYVIFINPAFTFPSTISGDNIESSFVISSVSLVVVLNLLFISILSPISFSVR